MSEQEYQLKGRFISVGLAGSKFTPEQLAESELSPTARLVIFHVDDDDPGNVPAGLVWADHVQLTLRELSNG